MLYIKMGERKKNLNCLAKLMSRDASFNAEGINYIRSPSLEKKAECCIYVQIQLLMSKVPKCWYVLVVFSELGHQIELIPFALTCLTQ